MDIFIPGLKHVSGYVPAFPRVFSVSTMWICKYSSFAFLLLCRKSHKIPLWISLWHTCIMQEWESCINNSTKKYHQDYSIKSLCHHCCYLWRASKPQRGSPRVSLEHPDHAWFHHWCSHDPNPLHSSWEWHSCQDHTSMRHLGNHW